MDINRRFYLDTCSVYLKFSFLSIHSPTPSFIIHCLIHLSIHSPIYSFIHPSSTHLSILLSIHLPSHPFIHLSTHSFTHSSAQSYIHSSIYSSVHSSISPFTTHLFILSLCTLLLSQVTIIYNNCALFRCLCFPTKFWSCACAV